MFLQPIFMVMPISLSAKFFQTEEYVVACGQFSGQLQLKGNGWNENYAAISIAPHFPQLLYYFAHDFEMNVPSQETGVLSHLCQHWVFKKKLLVLNNIFRNVTIKIRTQLVIQYFVKMWFSIWIIMIQSRRVCQIEVCENIAWMHIADQDARFSAFVWLTCQGQPTVSHFQGHCLPHCLSSCSFLTIIVQDYQLDCRVGSLCLGASLATVHSKWSSCPKYTKGKCFPLR